METHFTILLAPNQSHRQFAPQLATLRFVPNTAVEPSPNDVQFRFAHRPLQAKNQSIVEQCRMVQAIAVADQCIGDGTKVQQPVPVGIVARQPRNLDAQDDPYSAPAPLPRPYVQSRRDCQRSNPLSQGPR